MALSADATTPFYYYPAKPLSRLLQILESMGHAVFVFGGAGVGKTTFCKMLQERVAGGKKINLINLDPAQRNSEFYDVDLCEFISVDEVMEECDFGPNGALFHALKEMCDNIDALNLQDFEDEYFFFDCPGQIELFLHSDIMDRCIRHVQNFAKVAVVYLVDSTNFRISDKHLYTELCAAITAGRLYVPTLPVLTKCDLLDNEEIDKILERQDEDIEEGEDEYTRLRATISEYISYNGITNYTPLNWNDDTTIENLMALLDNVLQRYDDIEPPEPKED